MNEIEARLLIRRYGWTAFIRQKTSGRYLIASKRIEGRVVNVYISAMTRLPQIERKDILVKLPDAA